MNDIVLTPEKDIENEDESMHIYEEEVKSDDDVSEYEGSDENEAIDRVLNMMEPKLKRYLASAQPDTRARSKNISKKDTRDKNKFKARSPTITESSDSKLAHSSSSPLKNGEYRVKAEALKKTCEAFYEVGSDVMVTVETGKTFDLRSVQIKKHVPDTKLYRIFTYKNPRSKRYIKVLKCDHEGCDKWFRKWHNFFDHLRIHTNERPYVCPFPGCAFSFTQRANLNKHVEVHGGVKRF